MTNFDFVLWELGVIEVFFSNIHLFLVVLGLCCYAWAFSICDVWASHCRDVSYGGVRALELGFCSCGTQALLSVACGIFLNQVSNLGPLY